MKQKDVREKSDNAAVHAADGEELSGTVQLQTLLQHIDGGVCILRWEERSALYMPARDFTRCSVKAGRASPAVSDKGTGDSSGL